MIVTNALIRTFTRIEDQLLGKEIGFPQHVVDWYWNIIHRWDEFGDHVIGHDSCRS